MIIFRLIIFIFMANSLSAGYREGDFIISQFKTPGTHSTQLSNDVIRNETGDTLQLIDSVQPIRPGQVIMRKKINKEYRMYFGTLDIMALSKRPALFAFSIPGWANVKDILVYRFYRDPTEKIGNDEETVYFDNERIYVKNFSLLYYYRNGIWFKLEGTDSLLTGGLVLQSEPPGAQVILNGQNTNLITPCTIRNLLPGIHNLELFHKDYHFLQKSIKIFPDSIITASFQLISDMDTVYITGDARYGLLLLPQPPIDSFYKVDSIIVDEVQVKLFEGAHRIEWNGGILYESIDTVVSITNGIINYFDLIFKRSYGILRIIPIPANAEICIDNNPCRFGEQILEIPTGKYRISAYRYGYKVLVKEILVLPDTIVNCEMNLLQSPDGDGDGFTDSIDQCPGRYGLYDGCPRQRLEDALSIKKNEIENYVKDDPFSIDISAVGFIIRMPTKKRFANFLSAFSSGKIGGVNNYRGLTFFNSYQVSYKALFAAAELGQWTSGIHYQRSDTLTLNQSNGSCYQLFYDSLDGVEPVMLLPSTSLSFGVHYNFFWFNIAYSLGHQWEDIIIADIYNVKTKEFETVIFDNDWWYHQLQFETNFRTGESISPVAYFRFKFPFGKTLRTRWHIMQAGLQFKFIPRNKKSID